MLTLLFWLFVSVTQAQDPLEDSSPIPIESPQGLQQGMPAINFQLSTLDGRLASLQDYFGKPVLLVFFGGRRCEPCLKTLKEINKLYKREYRRGLVVLALNIDGMEEVKELKKLGIASKKEIPATFQAALEEGDLESAPLPNILEEPEDSPDEGEEQARSA